MTHSSFSPSTLHRVMRCPGSAAMVMGREDSGSDASREGTAAHTVAAWCLAAENSVLFGLPEYWIGKDIPVDDVHTVRFTAESAAYVARYVKDIQEYAQGGLLFIEKRVQLAMLAEGESGTPDAVIITDDGMELQIHDYKHGHTPVVVENNEQLMAYALGALDECALVACPERIRLVIHQPKVYGPPQEWVCTREELETFRQRAAAAIFRAKARIDLMQMTGEAGDLFPGEKQCLWCRAKAICPALAANCLAPFDDLTAETLPETVAEALNDKLSAWLKLGPLIDLWQKSVVEEAFARLNAGETIPDFKLVQGREGNRAWTNEGEAEQVLKSMRLKQDEMYTRKVIGPAAVDKLAKAGALSERQMQRIAPLITRSTGKTTIAPASDKRPAVNAVADAFDDLDNVANDAATTQAHNSAA